MKEELCAMKWTKVKAKNRGAIGFYTFTRQLWQRTGESQDDRLIPSLMYIGCPRLRW